MKNQTATSKILLLVIILFVISKSDLYSQTKLVSVANGDWDDAVTWSPQQVPTQDDTVEVRHSVSIPYGYSAKAYDLTLDNTSGNLTEVKLVGNTDRDLHVYGDLFMKSTDSDARCYLQISYEGCSVVVEGNVYMERAHSGDVDYGPRVRIFGGSMVVKGDYIVTVGQGESDANSVLFMYGDESHGLFPTLDILGTLKFSTTVNKSSSGMNLEDNAIMTVGSMDLDLTGNEADDRDFNFYVYDNAQVIVQNDVYVTRDGGSSFNIRLGKAEPRVVGEVSNATFSIGGNLTLEHLNGEDVSGDQLIVEINGTSSFHIGGDLSANSEAPRALTIEANETSTVTFEGDLNLTGSSPDNLRLDFNDASSVTFNGELIMDFPEGTDLGTVVEFNDNVNVIFNNTTSTTIIPEGFNFTNLSVNTEHGMQLSSDITVDGSIDLLKGAVDANGNTIYLTNTASTSLSRNELEATNPSYIYNGKLNRKMLLADGGNYLFPVGDATTYTPVVLSGLVGDDVEFEVEYFKSSPSNTAPVSGGLVAMSSSEYWDVHKVTSDPGNTIGVHITLSLTDNSSSTGDFDDIPYPSALRVAHWTGTEWENLGNVTGYNSTERTITTASAQYSFSDIGVGSEQEQEGTLPVELGKFDVRLVKGAVELSWETVSERDNDYFSVERSENGEDFYSIVKVDGNGTTSTPVSYGHTDYEVFAGTAYYRLKQVDYDGAFEYSHIVSINVSSGAKIQLFPNPAFDHVNIKFLSCQDEGVITITDIKGQEVFRKAYADSGQAKINLNGFDNGLYFVRLVTADNQMIKTTTFVKN